MTEKKRIHSNWIKTYLEYSSYSEAPDQFHFWTAVGTLAGALRRRVFIDQGYFQWTPNFYIIFVAPPGIVSKSTTASIGMNLLKRVPGVHFGPDAMTWQALITSLAGSGEQFLVDETYHTMSAITISSSEFGTFLNPNDREMVDVLVSLWDGQVGTFEKKTKTMGDDIIQNPWINLLACTTPAWIGGNFPEYMIGGGFMSRSIFVYAEKKRHLVPYPKDQLPANFRDLGETLVHDLEIIGTTLAGEYQLTESATKWGSDWYRNHYENPSSHLDTERLGGYLARKQTHMHKLAMVLAASRRNELIIDREDLVEALQHLDLMERDMNLIFSYINAPEARAANKLLQILEVKKKIERTAFFQDVFQSFSHNDFIQGIGGLIASGQARQHQVGNKIFIEYVEKAKPLVDINQEIVS